MATSLFVEGIVAAVAAFLDDFDGDVDAEAEADNNHRDADEEGKARH